MRLIDADKFKEYIQDGFEIVQPQFQTEKYRELSSAVGIGFLQDIDEQPTAYDLDAVIAELEEYMEEYSQVDEDGLHNAKWCAMGEALCVVKKGGKNG